MMKALSLHQPWASLWVTAGAKVHETRSWSTRHRRPLAVHAAKTIAPLESLDQQMVADMCDALGFKGGFEEVERQYHALPLGGVVGIVTLVDCVPTDPGAPSLRDLRFGNWSPGRFAWRRAEPPEPLTEIVRCRGFQGLWRLPDNLHAAINRRLPEGAYWKAGTTCTRTAT